MRSLGPLCLSPGPLHRCIDHHWEPNANLTHLTAPEVKQHTRPDGAIATFVAASTVLGQRFGKLRTVVAAACTRLGLSKIMGGIVKRLVPQIHHHGERQVVRRAAGSRSGTAVSAFGDFMSCVQGTESLLTVCLLSLTLVCALMAILWVQQQWQQRQLRTAALALLEVRDGNALAASVDILKEIERIEPKSITQDALAVALSELKAAAVAAAAADAEAEHEEFGRTQDASAATSAMWEATQMDLMSQEGTGPGAARPALARTEMPDWLQRAESSVLDVHEHETITPPSSPRHHDADEQATQMDLMSQEGTGPGAARPALARTEMPDWLQRAESSVLDVHEHETITPPSSPRHHDADEQETEDGTLDCNEKANMGSGEAALPQQVECSVSGETVQDGTVPPPQVYAKLQRARMSRRQSREGSSHSPPRLRVQPCAHVLQSPLPSHQGRQMGSQPPERYFPRSPPTAHSANSSAPSSAAVPLGNRVAHVLGVGTSTGTDLGWGHAAVPREPADLHMPDGAADPGEASPALPGLRV